MIFVISRFLAVIESCHKYFLVKVYQQLWRLSDFQKKSGDEYWYFLAWYYVIIDLGKFFILRFFFGSQSCFSIT